LRIIEFYDTFEVAAQIYDVLGILLLETQVLAGETIDTNLKPGTYFCRVQSGDGITEVIPFVVGQ